MSVHAIEVLGEFRVNWPSQKGCEIGAVYRSGRAIADDLKQPLIFSEGHLFAFFSLAGYGVGILHTEAFFWDVEAAKLSDLPNDFFDREGWYGIYVDQELSSANPFPLDGLKRLLGDGGFDIY